MKSTHPVPAQHNFVEVLSESLMATLIMVLSIAATLVAIMMVIAS